MPAEIGDLVKIINTDSRDVGKEFTIIGTHMYRSGLFYLGLRNIMSYPRLFREEEFRRMNLNPVFSIGDIVMLRHYTRYAGTIGPGVVEHSNSMSSIIRLYHEYSHCHILRSISNNNLKVLK